MRESVRAGSNQEPDTCTKGRNVKHAVVALVLAVTSGAAVCLDIKGLKVDKPVNCEAVKALETRTGTFLDACNNGRAEWYTETDFLNGKAMLRLTQSLDRTLLSVSVGESGSFNFETALDALTIKFGAPQSSEKSSIQNRMGASFEQMEAIWVDDDERIVLRKHGTSIGRPSLIYFGKRAAEEVNKERAEKAKKAAGSI